jgi:hypothetical protein
MPCKLAPPLADEVDWRGLPAKARAVILQHVDAGNVSTLLEGERWMTSISNAEFERLAHGLIRGAEHGALGHWPSPRDLPRLAEAAATVSAALREKGGVNATLLSNLCTASARLSAGQLTAADAVFGSVDGVALSVGGSRLVRGPEGQPLLIAQSDVQPQETTLLFEDGTVHDVPALRHLGFTANQVPGMCEVVDSRLEDTAGYWVVRNRARTRCCLYNPREGTVADLPQVLAVCHYAATSANGRHVVAASAEHDLLFLHDSLTGTTTQLDYTDRPICQLSVDSDGVVFIATPDRGLRFAPGKPKHAVDLDRQFTNYRLAPDERFLVANDATGLNLRLQDRHGGASKTLLHAARIDARNPHRNLSLTFSPGLAFIATTCTDGVLRLYDLMGTEHDAKLDPALEVPLRMHSRTGRVQNAVPWFDPDGRALNVAYTELRPSRAGLQVMRLPLG